MLGDVTPPLGITGFICSTRHVTDTGRIPITKLCTKRVLNEERFGVSVQCAWLISSKQSETRSGFKLEHLHGYYTTTGYGYDLYHYKGKYEVNRVKIEAKAARARARFKSGYSWDYIGNILVEWYARVRAM